MTTAYECHSMPDGAPGSKERREKRKCQAKIAAQGGAAGMAAQWNLCNIKFGEMNSDYLFTEDSLNQDTIDPQRSNPLLQIGRGIKSFFTRNLTPYAQGGARPQVCLILRAQGNSTAWVQNQVEAIKKTERHVGGVAEEGGRIYYKYKVWISEYMGPLECPDSLSDEKGKHQGRINAALDAYPAPNSPGELAPFPAGSLVHYEGDPSVGPVTLREGTGSQVLLPGVVSDPSHFQATNPSVAMGAPQVKGTATHLRHMYSLLRASEYFDKYSNATVAALAAWASVITMEFVLWDRPGHGHDNPGEKGPDGRWTRQQAGGTRFSEHGYWKFNTSKPDELGWKFLDWAVKKGKLNQGDLRDLVGKKRYETIMNEDLQFQYMAHLLDKIDPGTRRDTLENENYGSDTNPETAHLKRAGHMVAWIDLEVGSPQNQRRAADLANLLYNCHANPNDSQHTPGDQCKALER